jgi:hypothetical protein
MNNPTAPAKSAKKFHVFHERYVWKTLRVNKRTPPAEYSMIAASHSEHKPRVMRKTVRQPVYRRRGRQLDPKETAADFWIAHNATNLIQRFQRHFGIGVQKPENIALCGIGSEIHLHGAATLAAPNNLVAEAFRQLIGPISARAIDDNNFRPTGSVSQVRKKRAYQRRFIQDWNDNGDLHL